MKKRILLPLLVMVNLLMISAACTPQPTLTLEEHAILPIFWEGDTLEFKPLEGTREEILAKHASERLKPAPTFSLPVNLGEDELNAVENYNGSQVTVEVTRNGEQVLSIAAGVISPINNFRGLWVVDEHWYLEVAHVEENPEDPNAAFNIWGEIFMDGKSLNQQNGYDEAFNFQLLAGKPFFFYRDENQMGYSYEGWETDLDYSEIPHYLCCSASSFNPLSSETMVAFYARRESKDFYIELGLFQ